MDIKDKLIFALIFDLKGSFVIIKSKCPIKYRARIDLYMKEKELVFLNKYFNDYLSDIYINYYRKNIIRINGNKNSLLLLKHIKDYTLFNSERINNLIQFIYHRTSVRMKRYDMIDEDFYKKLK